MDSYRLVSEARLREIYGALDFIQYDPNDPNIVANWPNFPTYHFGPLESFKVNEKALGGFAMANFEGEGFRGNFGVRIVQTKQTSDGWAVGVPAGTPGADQQSVRPDRAAVDRSRLHRRAAEREHRVRSQRTRCCCVSARPA